MKKAALFSILALCASTATAEEPTGVTRGGMFYVPIHCDGTRALVQANEQIWHEDGGAYRNVSYYVDPDTSGAPCVISPAVPPRDWGDEVTEYGYAVRPRMCTFIVGDPNATAVINKEGENEQGQTIPLPPPKWTADVVWNTDAFQYTNDWTTEFKNNGKVEMQCLPIAQDTETCQGVGCHAAHPSLRLF